MLTNTLRRLKTTTIDRWNEVIASSWSRLLQLPTKRLNAVRIWACHLQLQSSRSAVMIPVLRLLFLKGSWHRVWKVVKLTKNRRDFDRISPYHYHRLNLHRFRNDLAQSSNKSLVIRRLLLSLLPRRIQLLQTALHHKRCSKEPRKPCKGQEWASSLMSTPVLYYNLSRSNSQHRLQCSSSNNHGRRISTRCGNRGSLMNSRVVKKSQKFPRLNQERDRKSLNRCLQDSNPLYRFNSQPYRRLQLCKFGSHLKDHRSVLLPLKVQMSISGHGLPLISNFNHSNSNSNSSSSRISYVLSRIMSTTCRACGA